MAIPTVVAEPPRHTAKDTVQAQGQRKEVPCKEPGGQAHITCALTIKGIVSTHMPEVEVLLGPSNEAWNGHTAQRQTSGVS